ncbi:hypothetical protein E3P92_02684 [Wallemia ichthyophaga]|uniref:Protein transport protein GOT1 n=1 Tax=Wallemia ichthyophaga TaxID=245174 RepID=A0A4T0K3D0_WALIC|nr:hypothetical protein E3P91_02957 [Wallemia ichthyophaga]TIA80005.1 hypothetical protein E3P98_02950 [Wallemia ichthyophaga]TIA88960.1 hypothetical protein E3P97_03301 [Wallemia ichthyophaga]TIA97452.1 hypothetical protein E3P96_03400 [Wallemia ichthyophaga]TIA97809.1 hypothetical protein E3P94_03184 [Wallemia ichthyophaga]
MFLTDLQKIGVGLTSFGGLFTLLGVVLFFDASLLALGNLLFLTGLILLIGMQKTIVFFSRPYKLRGTLCFVGGITLVLLKYTFIGFVVECIGFLNLFGSFFPVILNFLRQLPVIGSLLNLPVISTIANKVAGSRQSPV